MAEKIFIGIDLATTLKKTGICIISEEPGSKPSLLFLESGESIFSWWSLAKLQKLRAALKQDISPRPSDILPLLIAELIQVHQPAKVVVAIDSPFGWPTDFKEEVWLHKIGLRFQADRRSLKLRATDVLVQDLLGITPLSVSTDKLGAVAIEAADLIANIRDLVPNFQIQHSGKKVPKSSSERFVIEVYPRASLSKYVPDRRTSTLGITQNKRSKIVGDVRFPKEAWASRFLKQLGPHLNTDAANFEKDLKWNPRTAFRGLGAQESSFSEVVHKLDALVCAITARDYLSGNWIDLDTAKTLTTLDRVVDLGIRCKDEGYIVIPSQAITQELK